MPSESARKNPLVRWAWPLAVLGLFALRLPHLFGPLDDPHSWRQADTVHYTYEYVRHGIDLLRPQVCWLGGRGALIFEFTLPEAMAAVLGRMFGYTPVWDRLVALAFTALAAFWFHRIVRDISDKATARIATAVFLVAPLSQFYSRAPQVDFAAQAFAQGLLWHSWRSMRGGGWGHAAMAALCGALAAMIKVPYLLPILPPLALIAAGAESLLALAGTAAAFAVTGTAFLLWRSHVNAVNDAVPDWKWLPGFYKEVNPWWWYVGDWHTRLAPSNWIKLGRRMVFEIMTPVGALLVLAAPFSPMVRREGTPAPFTFALLWLGGAVAYMAVFFPLNLIHNYYQLPFLAPLSLLIGITVSAWVSHRAAVVRIAAGIAFAGMIALALVLPARLHWYRIDDLREKAGAVIAQYVPAQDLVVVIDHNSEYSDPRLLMRAKREGWPIMKADLTAELQAHLEHEGAKWVAWVDEPKDSLLAPPARLLPDLVATVPLDRPETRGQSQVDTLFIYRIGRRGGTR
jgi:hypothetical protein